MIIFSIWKNLEFNPNYFCLYFHNTMERERRSRGEGRGYQSLQQELLDQEPLIEFASDPPKTPLVFRFEGKEFIPTLEVKVIPGPTERPIPWKCERFDQTDHGFSMLVDVIRSDTSKAGSRTKKLVLLQRFEVALQARQEALIQQATATEPPSEDVVLLDAVTLRKSSLPQAIESEVHKTINSVERTGSRGGRASLQGSGKASQGLKTPEDLNRAVEDRSSVRKDVVVERGTHSRQKSRQLISPYFLWKEFYRKRMRLMLVWLGTMMVLMN